jgi:hypothetical protein
MENESKLKDCLVICPIGEEGTPERKRSDQVLKYIIQPIAENCGYDAQRADKIAKPGIITTQIIERLLNDPLVIADLTNHNANVFYELAIRHAARKPVVQIISTADKLPFDVSEIRTIRLDSNDMESQETCRTELAKHIKAVENDASLVDLQSRKLWISSVTRRAQYRLNKCLERYWSLSTDSLSRFCCVCRPCSYLPLRRHLASVRYSPLLLLWQAGRDRKCQESHRTWAHHRLTGRETRNVMERTRTVRDM